MTRVSVHTMPARKPAASAPVPKPAAKAGKRETVAALHQRRAHEQRETMARIAAIPATGNSLASILATEPDNAPSASFEVGFSGSLGSPAARARSGWSKAFDAAEKERVR